MRLNLSKEAFIGTGVAVACMVDISRLTLYSRQLFFNPEVHLNYPLLAAATACAFAGAYFGNKILKKITLNAVQFIVALMLIVFSLLLGLGIV